MAGTQKLHTKSGEGLQDYVADIQRLAQEAYLNMDPEFVDSVAVDSFVDGIRDWEMLLLVRRPSWKNITAALASALEVEDGRGASRRLTMVHQLKAEYPKELKSSSSKKNKNLNADLQCYMEASNTEEEMCGPRSQDFIAGIQRFQHLHHSMGWPAEEKDQCLCSHRHHLLNPEEVFIGTMKQNKVINQHEQMVLRTATGKSLITLGSVHMKLKLPASLIEGKFIVVDIYDEWILGLDQIRKYGLTVDPRSELLRAPHGDIPLLAMETAAVQQVCSEVDPVQELVKPYQEILSTE